RLNRVPRAQVTPSWSSLDYQERSVSQSEKRSKVRLNRVPRAQVTPSWSSSDYQERSVSQSEKRSKVRLNRGAQSPCQPLMELLNYQKRQVNVSLRPSEVCLKSDRREAGCTSVPTQGYPDLPQIWYPAVDPVYAFLQKRGILRRCPRKAHLRRTEFWGWTSNFSEVGHLPPFYSIYQWGLTLRSVFHAHGDT